jgi:putative membrane protein
MKVLHVLFVIAWLAGVFYLPRICVHYVEGLDQGEDVRRLVIMAGKLLRFSTVMACIAILAGLILWLYYDISGLWLHVKLLFVALLIGYHYQSYRYWQKMRSNQIIQTSLFFRIYNEAALLLVIPILILVIVKPFY